jgi:DNA-binding transcriptional LysR family regulator
MHISAIDLNLVVVLRALLDERSVSRAARRLGLSQSATSHALGRLREVVKDPLFVRTRTGLVPTARAEAMAASVRTSLDVLDETLIDESLREHGLQRHIAFRTPSFLAAPQVVAATDLVMVLPARLAIALERQLHLATFELPL